MKYITCKGASVLIEIPKNAKHLMVAVSGGADSALLLYLVAKELKATESNCTLSAFTVPRPDGGANYSPKIVQYVSKLTGVNVVGPMIVGDGNEHYNTVVEKAIAGLLNINYYDYIFVAENKVPPIKIDAIGPARSPSQFAWKRLILPFYYLKKDEIIDLYYKDGIEDLLNYSHSCTQRTVGRCNECFNCVERVWAFNQIGKTDTGEM